MRFVQPYCTTEVTDMLNQLVETGWQRFLDRLKQLLGKPGRSDLPVEASATDALGASTPGASGDTTVARTSGP
jgi:hypothetical protein